MLAESLLVITRPLMTGEAMKGWLADKGYRAVAMPAMVYHSRVLAVLKNSQDIKNKIASCSALVFTSANGVRAYNELSSHVATPINPLLFAVGRVTADAVKQHLGRQAIVAGGDVASLVDVIFKSYKKNPWQGATIHIGGQHGAGEGQAKDLVSRLREIYIPTKNWFYMKCLPIKP